MQYCVVLFSLGNATLNVGETGWRCALSFVASMRIRIDYKCDIPEISLQRRTSVYVLAAIGTDQEIQGVDSNLPGLTSRHRGFELAESQLIESSSSCEM